MRWIRSVKSDSQGPQRWISGRNNSCAFTSNVCVTGRAGSKVESPGCWATNEQLPALLSVISAELTPPVSWLTEAAHTAGVCALKVTVKPEDAVAVIMNGGSAHRCAGNAPKFIVCATCAATSTAPMSHTGV